MAIFLSEVSLLTPIYLPLGNVFILAAADASEQTVEGIWVIHALIVIAYSCPGERLGILHSLAFESHDKEAVGAPVPVISTK